MFKGKKGEALAKEIGQKSAPEKAKTFTPGEPAKVRRACSSDIRCKIRPCWELGSFCSLFAGVLLVFCCFELRVHGDHSPRTIKFAIVQNVYSGKNFQLESTFAMTTDDQRALKNALAKATTLEEVERLTQLLKSGQDLG